MTIRVWPIGLPPAYLDDPHPAVLLWRVPVLHVLTPRHRRAGFDVVPVPGHLALSLGAVVPLLPVRAIHPDDRIRHGALVELRQDGGYGHVGAVLILCAVE